MLKHAMGCLACLVALLLGSCGDDHPEIVVAGSVPSVERTSVHGTIVLPPGVEATEVVNVIGAAPVSGDQFTIETFAAGPLLAIAVASSGEPVAAGWLGPDEDNVIDARSSAEVAAYFGFGGPFAAPNLAPEVQEQLMATPELDAVAVAFGQALEGSPNGLDATDVVVAEALLEAAETVLDPKDGLRTRGLTINPPGSRSGLRLDQLGGVNELTIVNTYRRRAFAFIDRVSVVTESGEMQSPKKIKDVPIDPIAGTDGATGTLSQILNATQEPGGFFGSENVAHVPRSFGPYELPNVANARRTNYRVAIVGPGSTAGDTSELSEEELEKLDEVSLEFVVKDVLLPFVLNVAIPSTQLDEYLDHPLMGSVVSDVAKAIGMQYPTITERLRMGDIRGVVTELVTALGGASTLRDVMIDIIRERFYDLSTAAGDAAFGRASGLAAKFVAVTGAVDLLGTLFETGVLLGDSLGSEQANVWTVVATDAVIRLQPMVSRIAPGEFVTLEVNVVDGEDDTGYEYRYSTSGEAGTLQSALMRGNAITSSVNAITYDATMPGSDEVRVDVYLTGPEPDELLGTAIAEVKVEGEGLFVTPLEPEVDPYASVELGAMLFAADVPDLVTYRWSVDGEGTVDGEAELEESAPGDEPHTVEFRAGFRPGPQTVTVEAFEPGEDGGEPRLLATASADVEVRAWRVGVTPASSAVEAGDQVTLTGTVEPAPPEGTIAFDWAVATTEGLVDGARMVSHTVTGSSSDMVVYEAVAMPTACVQRVELMTTLLIGGEMLELRPASATIRVACDTSATVTATPAVIATEGTSAVRVTLSDIPEGELSYSWSLTEGNGTLQVGSTPVGADPIESSVVTYVAPDAPGTERVEVAVLLDTGSGPMEIATAGTSITTSGEDVYGAGWVIENIAHDRLQSPGVDCPTIEGFEEVFAHWLLVCPDLETPYYRIEVDVPALSVPAVRYPSGNDGAAAIESPASMHTVYAPPFADTATQLYDDYGPPSEGTRWIHSPRSIAGCHPPAQGEVMREWLMSWRVDCYGTFTAP